MKVGLRREGPGRIQKVPDPMQSNERASRDKSQLELDREASERLGELQSMGSQKTGP